MARFPEPGLALGWDGCHRQLTRHWIAERVPNDATADYPHKVFEPTAQAIDGPEKALAGLGLLDDALALDLRRAQDYFQRLWNTGFRAADLARPFGEPTERDNRQDAAGEPARAVPYPRCGTRP